MLKMMRQSQKYSSIIHYIKNSTENIKKNAERYFFKQNPQRVLQTLIESEH